MKTKKAAKALGWFSIGLGLTQVLMPTRLGHLTGVGDQRRLMRLMGVRELATGAGILMQRRPEAGLWARVAGDVLDATLLASAYKSRSTTRGRIAGAVGMVSAVGIADYLCARRMQKGRQD